MNLRFLKNSHKQAVRLATAECENSSGGAAPDCCGIEVANPH